MHADATDPDATDAEATARDLGAEWLAAMRAGDFAAAWRVADAVLAARAGDDPFRLPRHLRWCWDGTPLAGRRVLVHCWHGLGDTLKFVRLLPLLRARGCTTILRAQPALLPLLRTADGIDTLVALGDDDDVRDLAHDVAIELMELPHALRLTVADIPARVPYLHVDAPPRTPDGTRHLGLVWAAGDWAPERTMHFRDVRPLFALPGITWHVLQRGPALAQCDATWRPRDASDDVLATARTLRTLDGLVTVDSMPLHLAGALGVPATVLLPEPADWRWMTGTRTPWYPTHELLRQRAPGDWRGVVRALCDRLASP